MAEGRESFVFYKSFYNAIKQIPEEYQLELYNAILQYSLEGIEPNGLSSIASAMFTLMKPNIDSSQKKYEASVENGKKGGRPKKETQEKPKNNPTKTQEKPKANLNDNVDVNDNVDDNVDVNVNENVTVADVIKEYENNIAPATDFSRELLLSFCDDLSPELVKESIKKSVLANKRNLNYIKRNIK